jgi:hypothetical protein
MVMALPSEGTSTVVNEELMEPVAGEAMAEVIDMVVGGWEKTRLDLGSITKLDGCAPQPGGSCSLYIMRTNKVVTIPTKLVQAVRHLSNLVCYVHLSNLVCYVVYPILST